jgi:hypothetical protein
MRVFLTKTLGRKCGLTAIALALALGGTISGPLVLPGHQAARADVIAISTHERLSRYGEWRTSSRFGEVWVPTVRAGWRPYTVGHWVWTDDGWYWQSDEPFGWVAFHYGRWAFDPDFGWVWIAGNEWAPAWVVWRESDDNVGWVPAPPPQVVVVEDDWWSFVPVAAIGAAAILPVLRPVSDNVTYVRNTTIINENVTVNNYYRRAGTVHMGGGVVPVNAGPPLSRLPGSVVKSVRAAKVVPPKNGAVAAAHLDPTKGTLIKTAAIGQTPTTVPTSNPGNVQKKPLGPNVSVQNGGKVSAVPTKPASPAASPVTASAPVKPQAVKVAKAVKPIPPSTSKPAVSTKAASRQLLVQRQAALLQQRRTAQAKALVARQQVMKREQQAMVMHARAVSHAQAVPHRQMGQMQAKRTVKCDPHDPRCRRPG